MKKLLFFLLFPFTLLANDPAEPQTAGVQLICHVIDLPANADSLFVFELRGLAFQPIASAPKDAEGKFVFNLPSGPARLYGIGISQLTMAKVILGEEPKVTLWSNANFMDKARTIGSDANKGLENLRNRIDVFRIEENKLLAADMQARDAATSESIAKDAARLTQAKSDFLDSLQKKNKLLYGIASLYLHPDYSIRQDKSLDRTNYLARYFFANANLSDKSYEDNPEVYDAFMEYTGVLLGTSNNADKIIPLIEQTLNSIPPDSKTYRLALAGVTMGLKNNGPAFSHFANMYIKKYRSNSWGEIGKMEYELKKLSVFTVGMEAPDLVGPTPEGSEFALSKLRGKYVLVDFWASWCGPCRRENPNVKAAYDKYKGKGFEILGVSLDRTKDAWVKAIEADGLPWHHISDLQGWKSEHAQLYSVTSIPATVLLDKEGKIIARNLRGPQLEAKLEEIFGQ